MNCGVKGEFGLEHDMPLQMRSKEAVTGNAEFLRQVGVNVGNGFHALIVAQRLGGLAMALSPLTAIERLP